RSSPRDLGLAQMRQTIFFAVSGNAKLQVGIAQLGRAANGAVMQGLGIGIARLDLETVPPRRHLLAIARLANNFRSKKEEVVSHGRDGGGAELHRPGDDLQEQQSSREPCNPFNLQWKNVGEINNEIG